MVDRGIGVVLAIIGLASLAVILSKRSNTAKVIQVFFSGLNGAIGAATKPATLT